MKKVLYLMLLISSGSYAQKTTSSLKVKNCVNNVSRPKYKKIIPEGICFGADVELAFLNNSIDFDKDSVNDFSLTWYKLKQKDGDTTYVSFYLMKNRKAVLFKSFNNLYPINFNNLNDKNRKKDKFTKTFLAYEHSYPLREIKIKDDSIVIEFTVKGGGGQTGKQLTYKYDKKAKDWLMIKSLNTDYLGAQTKYENYVDDNINKSIKLFNYVDYLE